MPLAPGNRVFLFSARNFSKCQAAAVGQREPKNPLFCDFLPLGVWSVKTQNVKKLRSFREKLLGVRFFVAKVPLAPANRVFLFSARSFSKCQGAALGQKGLKTQYFAIFRPWGPAGQNAKCKKVAQFSGETFGCPVFSPKSAPSSRKSRFSVFGPEFPVFCDFLPLGVRSVKTQNVKKLRSFREKLLGVRFFFPKEPLAPGNCVFLCSTQSFSKCQGAALGQKGLKTQYFAISSPWGSGRSKRKK